MFLVFEIWQTFGKDFICKKLNKAAGKLSYFSKITKIQKQNSSQTGMNLEWNGVQEKWHSEFKEIKLKAYYMLYRSRKFISQLLLLRLHQIWKLRDKFGK